MHVYMHVLMHVHNDREGAECHSRERGGTIGIGDAGIPLGKYAPTMPQEVSRAVPAENAGTGNFMGTCNRKTFDTEWEAIIYIGEHPWPEPAPPVIPFLCRACGKVHISDKPPRRGTHAKPRRR